MTKATMPIIHLFFCYCQEDKALREELDMHLAMLKRLRQIKSWHDQMISPGNKWEREIEHQLSTAQIILLLISPDFLASSYCYEKEMMCSLQRHEAGDAHVIPIILRHVDWHDAPFHTLQMLPTNAQPLSNWLDRDAFFTNVAQGIRKVVDDILTKQEAKERCDDHKPAIAAKTMSLPKSNQSPSTEKYKIHANKVNISSMGDNFGTITISNSAFNLRRDEDEKS